MKIISTLLLVTIAGVGRKSRACPQDSTKGCAGPIRRARRGGDLVNQIRRALCPGRVRSCHYPSFHVPGCSFCSFYSFLSIPGAIGSKSVLLDGWSAVPWRLPGGSLVDSRYGSRLFVHSKNVGFYPSICIGVVRERTKAANIPTTSPNLWFHGPIFHHMHYFFIFF